MQVYSMAGAATAPACPAASTGDFWSGVCSRVDREIADCNAICGSTLWKVAARRRRLKVAAAADPLDFVEAVFHAGERLVHCRIGKHAHDLPEGIRIDTSMVTVDQAAEIILSGLRFPEF
jgi:hypothetical protein